MSSVAALTAALAAPLRLAISTALRAGSIAGFGAGDGIDLADIAFSRIGTTLGYAVSTKNSGGHFAVSDGTHIAALTLLGQYAAASFVLPANGHGGTLITGADTTNQLQRAGHVRGTRTA